MCTCYPIINRVSELKVHIELTRFVQPEKIEIDANERAVNEKSQYCFFVCTTFDSFLNDYFGNWYSARRLPIMEDSLRKVPEAALEKKLEALKLYTSQKGAVASNIHMAEYENWIRATDW